MHETEQLAREIRRLSLGMVYRAGASHIGGALSMADILAVLYGRILRYDPSDPGWTERDRFLLSKGHSCTALYAVLARTGFFPEDLLGEFGADGSSFLSHASHHVPGVELSTGSLGHALSVGCGMALAARRRGAGHRVFVLVSDGELDEGSNWEALLFAQHHRLDNLTLIVDYNKIQSLGRTSEVMALEPLLSKFAAFNWQVREADGHDHGALCGALTASGEAGKPQVVIAHTVKGKGVGFMEDTLKWHYKSPSPEEYEEALRQIGRDSA